MFCRIGIKISSHCLARVDHASSLRFWANLGATFGEFKAEVPEDGHAEPPKAQSPRKRSFWLELSGSAVLETRSVFFLVISKYFKCVNIFQSFRFGSFPCDSSPNQA